MGDQDMFNLLIEWFTELPPVTRFYLGSCVVTALLVALEVVTPLHMYYNWHAIIEEGQLWRLVTNFLFFGSGIECVAPPCRARTRHVRRPGHRMLATRARSPSPSPPPRHRRAPPAAGYSTCTFSFATLAV